MERPQTGPSSSARLLAREAGIAAIGAGRDVVMDGATGESLACLHGPLLADPARVGLVVVPDGTHALCLASQASGLPVKAVLIRPDSSEEDRRALGIALQNRTVQLVLVTPERLGQPRFVQFIRGLSLAYVALASCQRMLPQGAGDCGPLEACRKMRELFPGVPLLGLADTALLAPQRNEIATALGMVLPVVAPPALAESALAVKQAPDVSPPTVQPAPRVREEPAAQTMPVAAVRGAPVSSASIPEPYRAAFALFEKEISVEDAVRELGRESAWVWRALESFIRFTGRKHPFPWVSKPVYMTVSLASGQAETLNPRLIESVLRGQVDAGPILLVLAALENRNRHG